MFRTLFVIKKQKEKMKENTVVVNILTLHLQINQPTEQQPIKLKCIEIILIIMTIIIIIIFS